MTVLIHTIGGFTYAAALPDVLDLGVTNSDGVIWTEERVLEEWVFLFIRKGLLYLPGSKDGLGVWNATIRVEDIVSIEHSDAVEVVV